MEVVDKFYSAVEGHIYDLRNAVLPQDRDSELAA